MAGGSNRETRFFFGNRFKKDGHLHLAGPRRLSGRQIRSDRGKRRSVQRPDRLGLGVVRPDDFAGRVFVQVPRRGVMVSALAERREPEKWTEEP